jgi:hypothetical protein
VIFSHKGGVNFQFLQDSGTSSIYPPPQIDYYLNKFSDEIKPSLDKLFTDNENEDILYEICDLVAKWFVDASDEYHSFILSYLHNLPLLSKQILIASLSDAGFLTTSEDLIFCVSLYLRDNNKRLAQMAAIFLLTCGSNLGNMVLRQILDSEDLPHSKFIESIVKLVSS